MSTVEEENVKDLTYGRRVSRSLSRFRWYYPSSKVTQNKNETPISNVEDGSADEQNNTAPDLDKGWYHFEHAVLPRMFSKKDDDKDSQFHRAPPGEVEEKTQLYPIWGTSIKDLADFGIGVALYFYAVRFFALLSLIAGFINIPRIIHFASGDYNNKRDTSKDSNESLLEILLRRETDYPAKILEGSAICTNVSWEPCPTCTEEDWPRFLATDNNDRLAKGISPVDGSEVTFIKKNDCAFDDSSYLGLITVIVFMIALYFFFIAEKRRIVELDDDNQTTSDYSIVIRNPPKDSRDPEKWKQFFESNFDNLHVTVCTIALSNERLIKALVRRRKLMVKIQDMLPRDEVFDPENIEKAVKKCPSVPIWKKMFFFASDANAIYKAIRKQDKIIEEKARLTYDVSNVFCTFETQEAQHMVLKAMTYPYFNPYVVRKGLRFEGTLLKVTQPSEPSAIRWEDLSCAFLFRMWPQVITTIITFALIVGGGVIIALARRRSAEAASLTITLCNIITPQVVRILTSFEPHPNEASYSASNYLKMTTFRWTNTAIILTIITPFTDTLQNGEHLLDSIYVLFMFDLLQRPILQLSDIIGNLKRHFFAPRALDQRRMNLAFETRAYDIGERYTEITRILFLTVFYGTIFPAAFFFTALSLTTSFWLDKFSILRSWKQGPKIGAYISTVSTAIFLIIGVVFAMSSSYSHSQFPFDNTCETGENITNAYAYNGTFEVFLINKKKEMLTVEVLPDTKFHKFCDQEIIRYPAFPLPSSQPKGNEWMLSDQERASERFGWTFVAIIVIVGLTLIFRTVVTFAQALLCYAYQPSNKKMNAPFSETPLTFAYVPEIEIAGYAYPFILCSIDEVDNDLLNWIDPNDPSYRTHNLMNDVKNDKISVEINPKNIDDRNKDSGNEITVLNENTEASSIVKHWLPIKKEQ